MNSVDEAPAFPRGKQTGQCIGKAMLESRHDNAAGRAWHTLHISQHERGCDAVGLARAPSGDDNGSVRADKLREALRAVEVNLAWRGGFHKND